MSHKKYFGSFDNREDMHSRFFNSEYDSEKKRYVSREISSDFPTEDQILFAHYNTGSYEGNAIVVFEKDNQVYLLEASHCSCYGLEGQWDPDPVEDKQLRAMYPPSEYSTYPFDDNDAQNKFRELWPYTPLEEK